MRCNMSCHWKERHDSQTLTVATLVDVYVNERGDYNESEIVKVA